MSMTIAPTSALQATTSPVRRKTREDFWALPEGPPYFELIDGEFVEVARPNRNHDFISGRLYLRLAAFLEDAGLGDLSREPNLLLSGEEDVYHPDLAYIAPEREADYRDQGIFGVPDMVCEILSPRTAALDRGHKRKVYARSGVRHLWLIYPNSPVQIEEYILNDAGEYALRIVVASPAEWTPALFPTWTLLLTDLEAAIARRHPV